MLESDDFYGTLAERTGDTYLRQRLTIQVEHAGEVLGRGRTLMHIENAEWLMIFIYYALKVTRLFNIGRRNMLDIQYVENAVVLPNLPRTFDGYKLLHLSDLHLDIDPDLTDAIIARLQGVAYDLCVVTGDFRASSSGGYDLALDYAGQLVKHLKPPVYAVLGNHDFVEFVPPLEEAGYSFLLNETIVIERDGAKLYLSGVDDPHFYETDNLYRTRDAIPTGAPSILLAHSPEIYRHAAAAGYDFMLSGHTHAGQFCLPGRIPIQTNIKAPRSIAYGAWRHHSLQGYTSAGTGSCGVPARFFCPPEITIHRLRSA